MNGDQKFGIEIVRRAIRAPLRQIAANAGEDGAVVSGRVLENADYAWGFDARPRWYGRRCSTRPRSPDC